MPSDSIVKAPKKPQARSRVTNGKSTLPGVDGRSVWVRRLNDLIVLFQEDLGGDEGLTEMQRALIRRAATLTVELERAEAGFATAGAADPAGLREYQTASNSLRRILETLGLPRHMPALKQIDTSPAVPEPLRSGYLLGSVNGDEGSEFFSSADRRKEDLQYARALAFAIAQAVNEKRLVPESVARLAEELKLARIIRHVDGAAQLGRIEDAAIRT